MYTPNEGNVDTVKSVFSMIPMVKIISFLYEIEKGKNRVGKGREGERDSERNGLRQ